ncbi:Ribulose-phosphate 3-epimerase cytoplasmic isoform [Bienertia sinuspersici]
MLSLDFTNLASEAQRMLLSGANWLHIDIIACFLFLFLSIHIDFLINC